MTDALDFVSIAIDHDAAAALAGEARRDPRHNRPWKGYRQTPQAARVRPYRGKTYRKDPWNAPCAMRLFVCDSVREMLGNGSDYK